MLVATSAILFTTGCFGTDLDDYCGEPAVDAASWEDGSEFTAAELRDGLLGLWVGTVTFDGADEAMTLVFNDPTDDPSLITYPDEGEGSGNMSVSDACLDTLEVLMPTQIILDDSGVDIDFELELHETGFSAGWTADAELTLSDCSTEPCGLSLSFDRYDASDGELTGKLSWVDTTEDGDGAQPISDVNVSLTRVTE
jgi:hypothetical protein